MQACKSIYNRKLTGAAQAPAFKVTYLTLLI